MAHHDCCEHEHGHENHHEHGHEHEHEHHHEGGLRNKLTLIVVTAVLLVGCVLIEKHCALTTWQLLLVYLVPYLLIGHDTLREAAEGLVHGEAFNEHFLMSVATIGALCIGFLPGAETEFPEAVFVMLFFQIGELCEGYAEGKSRDSIAHLMDIRPDVATIVEYLDYFGPQGTWEKPWSFVYDKTNIDINIDWHIVRDYHLIFDGGTFTMNGGDIYIDQGASLWLKNIRFRGIDRHVYVYGTLYIDENVDFADIVRFIHVCRGGEIRFVTKPDYTVNIIVGEEDIVIDKAVIYGIIKAWLQYLNITLPDGYKWEYDDATHTIAITFSSGINDIQADRNAEEPVYDLSGKKLSKPRKGLNIVGGKKAVIK